MIWGLCTVANKIPALLACYTMYIGSYLPSLECWTLDGGPDMLSRNVAKKLSVYSAYNHWRTEIPTLIHSVHNVVL